MTAGRSRQYSPCVVIRGEAYRMDLYGVLLRVQILREGVHHLLQVPLVRRAVRRVLTCEMASLTRAN